MASRHQRTLSSSLLVSLLVAAALAAAPATNGRRPAAKPPTDASRQDPGRRALRGLDRLSPAEGREAARQFLDQYQPSLQAGYHSLACTAVYLIGEAAASQGLTLDELRLLEKLAAQFDVGSLPGLAAAVLAEDRVRGLPPVERAQAIRHLWGASTGMRSGYLLLHHYQIPETMRDSWERGERWEKYRKRNYEESAGDYYFRFRAKKFPTVQAELEFLWERILAQYARSARPGQKPDDLEVYQFEEARAATARMIEIGPPAVSFLLDRSDFILRAADPQDPRSTVGDIYEIWVMRALLDPAFTSLLQRLARCGSPKVEKAAQDALARMERDDPYPYRGLFVFHFLPPMGA